MWYKLKCVVMTIIVIIAVFMARDLSKPLWENGYDISYENNIYEDSVSVGAFGEENQDEVLEFRQERVSSFKEIIDLISKGAVPLIMYLLSVLCLVDLIKSTYIKFNNEEDLLDKTVYVLFIVGQMVMIGLISYYVISISIEVLILWIFVAISVTSALYLGPGFVQERRNYKR